MKTECIENLGAMDGKEAIHAHRIRESLHFMAQNLNKPLQVSTLATLARTSPSYFFALFKRHTGKAPIEYFIRLRMGHACQMLEETNLNIKEIAAALGYDDQFYFSRLFKSVKGVSPKQYRAETVAAEMIVPLACQPAEFRSPPERRVSASC